MADSEKCVCCGEIIPEGRQVCPKCEKRTELKPCPFCGGEAKYIHMRYVDSYSHGFVRCTKCRIGLLQVKRKSESIKDWNRGAEDGK